MQFQFAKSGQPREETFEDRFTAKFLIFDSGTTWNHRVKKLAVSGTRCLDPEAAAKNKEERQGSPTGEKPMPRSHASSRSGRVGPAGDVLHVLDIITTDRQANDTVENVLRIVEHHPEQVSR